MRANAKAFASLVITRQKQFIHSHSDFHGRSSLRQYPVHQIRPSVKMTVSRSRGMCLAVLVAVCFFISGCDQPQQPAIEAPPLSQPAQAPEPVQLPKLSPPKLL